GDFIDGKQTGKGTLTFISGSIYKGDFIDGKQTGKGTMIFSDGDIYKGDFIDGKCHGKGKMIFSDGTIQEGNFIDGIISPLRNYGNRRNIIEECPICNEDTFLIEYWKCRHSVCNTCTNNLVEKICPLCRSALGTLII
ncbi:MAG: RING-HC finger protein, partial [Nanoarchaeota archaeon]